MIRSIQSAEAIQEYLHARINEYHEVCESHSVIRLSAPQRREADEDGCNWAIQSITGDFSGYEMLIKDIIVETGKKFNLPN